MQQRGRLTLVLLLGAALGGCAVQPAEYRSDREIPEGPGMVSGSDGRLLYFSDTAQSDSRSLFGGGRSDASASEVGMDEQTFREFQRFQEYQEWKEQARDTGEYQEFREWLRWREYQRWEGGSEG